MIVPYRQGVLTYGIKTPFVLRGGVLKWHPYVAVRATISDGPAEYAIRIDPSTPITLAHTSQTYWIVAQIDENTAKLSVFTTDTEQDLVYVDSLPSSANHDDYLFVIGQNSGYRFVSGQWSKTLRVKLAKVSNGIVDVYSASTQVQATSSSPVSYTIDNESLEILLDSNGEPIKLFSDISNYVFACTGSSNPVDNFNPQHAQSISGEGLSAFNLLEYNSLGQIVVCKKNSINQCIGMTLHSVANNKPVQIETNGFVVNSQWFFSSFGDPVFVNSSGFISTTPPDPDIDASIQAVGITIARDTILLSIEPVILIT